MAKIENHQKGSRSDLESISSCIESRILQRLVKKRGGRDTGSSMPLKSFSFQRAVVNSSQYSIQSSKESKWVERRSLGPFFFQCCRPDWLRPGGGVAEEDMGKGGSVCFCHQL